MAGIKDYSLTAGSNATINGVNVAEGCPPSGINDAIRQQMADTRAFYESSGWVEWGHTCTYASGTTFTVASNVTSVYTANRRVRAVGSSTGTIYGTVSSSSYSAPNTTVTVVWDSGSLSNESLAVSVGFVGSTGSPVSYASLSGKPTLGTAAVVNTGTSGPTIPLCNGQNEWGDVQTAATLALSSGTAWDGSASQHLTVAVNGSAFTIANPSAQVAGAVYLVYVSYTTSHSIAWGTVFKGITGITPSATAGKSDAFLFRSNGANMECIGSKLDVGA